MDVAPLIFIEWKKGKKKGEMKIQRSNCPCLLYQDRGKIGKGGKKGFNLRGGKVSPPSFSKGGKERAREKRGGLNYNRGEGRSCAAEKRRSASLL